MSRGREKGVKTSLSEESLPPLHPTRNVPYGDSVLSALILHPLEKISMVVCSYSAQQNMSQKSFFSAMVHQKLFINVVSIPLHTFLHFTHDHQAAPAHPCKWMSQEMKSARTITNFHAPGV